MDIVTVVYILTAAAISCFVYIKWAHSYWKRRGVHHLEPEFLWGNSREVFFKTNSLSSQIEKMYKEMKQKGYKYGGYYFMLTPVLLPLDMELIKSILQKDFSQFVNRGMYINETVDPLTGHLFNLEDDKWRHLRTKLSPTFTSGKLKMMFKTLVDCTTGLDDILRSHVLMQDGLDVKEVISRFSTDVIGSCAFGIECNSLKNPDSEFRKYGSRIFHPESTFTRMLTRAIPSKILHALAFKKTDKNIEDFFLGVVRNTINYRETNNIYRKDFMHLLLQLKNRGEVTEDEKLMKENDSKKSDNYLSFNEIAAQCYVFFTAGFETSATATTFALYELAENQDIQDKLREEINAVIEKYGGEMTYDAIMEMKYLDKVVHEILRKHPPLGVTPRVCNKAYKIPGTDDVIEPGTRLHIPIQAIHRDPEYYPNPDKFDPERFSAENISRRPAFAFLPFGEGPRICIGARFGLMQIKVGLTTVIRKFRVTVNKRMQTPITYANNTLVTAVKGGVWLDVHDLN